MDLRELGALLRQEREARGLSLDEVMDTTKISRRTIQAIEDGRRQDMPHAVYSKGFIRNYARLLGLEEAITEQALLEAFPPEEERPHEPAAMDLKTSVRLHAQARNSSKSGLWLGVLVLLLAGLGAFAWLAPDQLWPRFLPRPSLGRVVAPSPAMPPQEQPVPPAPPPAPAAERPADPTPPPAAEAKAAPQAGLAPETAATDHAVSSDAVTPGAKVLEIKAAEPCWIEIATTSGKKQEFYLLAGDSRRVEVSGPVTVKLGNAGGVRMMYDGREVGGGARSGEVRSYTFQ